MFVESVGNNSAIVDITSANITSVNIDLNIDTILDIATINNRWLKIGESSFALITSPSDGGSVHIVNMDDPYNPLPASFVTDSSTYPRLGGFPNTITTATIDSSTYALVTSTTEDSVQIINITDPYNPTPASYVTDDIGNYTTLDFPSSIVTTTIDSSTYALVTSRNDDGVQIIDITDPYNPTPVTDIIDDRDGFTTLSDATDIAITTIGSSILCQYYALVISASGPAIGGVQIIDITTPSNPTAVSAAITDPGGITDETSIDTH